MDELSDTFAALADANRRRILARLTEGEATVTELAAPLPISVQAVSKHLKVLERAGLIERGRRSRVRPSRLRGRQLRVAAEWLHGYHRFWGDSFDRMEGRLQNRSGGDG